MNINADQSICLLFQNQFLIQCFFNSRILQKAFQLSLTLLKQFNSSDLQSFSKIHNNDPLCSKIITKQFYFNLQLRIQYKTSIMSAQKKTRRSMVSTSYMSMRKTQNFGKTDQFDNKNLSYAHIPMKKQTPDWNQSSATWRNSSPKYAFPKGSRFLTQKCSHLDIIQPEIPSTKSPVTCTFGKGNKRPISNIILRNAAQKPAPDRYDLTNQDQKSRSMEKGKSFGLGWKHYEKVYIDWRKDNYSFHFSNRNPPAIYNVRETPGKQAKKIAMHERLKMYTERMCQAKKHVPGPVHQIQDRHLSFMVGLNDRSFGFGERLDLAKPANDFPGAKYQIKGFTDIINKRNKYDQ